MACGVSEGLQQDAEEVVLTPRPYQLPAIEALANTRLGYLVAPAGSGKTIMMALAIKMHEVKACRPLHVVWLAGTKEIVEQGENACKLAGLLGTQEFHCWQGLDRVPDCDMLVIDECHAVAAPCYKRLLRSTLVKKDGQWARRCITLAMSATPVREDGEPIEPIVGPCVYTVDPQVVKDAGGVLPAEVRVIQFDDPEARELAEVEAGRKYRSWMSDEQMSRVLWQSVKHHGIVKNKRRNGEAVRIASQHVGQGDSVIVLVETIEQGKEIADQIDGAEVLHAGIAKGLRSGRVADFRAGKLRCVVATQILDEGADFPIANVLIMARGGRAEGRLIQRAGRVLRPYEGKDRGLIYDFCDRTHGMLTGQFFKRLKIYNKMGYKVDYQKK